MDFNLDRAIRKVPNFPKPGILFYDVTGILTDPSAFAWVLTRLQELYRSAGLDAIAAVEARGFIFAAPLAWALGLPLILVRKKGKLPGPTRSRRYALEYGEAEIEIQTSDVVAGERVLVLDDLLATGGTLAATSALLEELGAVVVDLFCVVGLPFLHPEKLLGSRHVTTLINYQSE